MDYALLRNSLLFKNMEDRGEQFKTIESMKSCYICRYREDSRDVVGYFEDKGESVLDYISYPDNRIFPEELEKNRKGMRIHFPLAYTESSQLFRFPSLLCCWQLC